MILLRNLVPKRYRYILSELKNLVFEQPKTSYSQFGEDIALSRLFHEKSGTYVDVGAHHPKRYSNTYLLYKRGWSGVNIDANPHTIRLFNRARPRDINLCIGIADATKEMAYYRFSDPAVNTFIKSEADKWKNKDWLSFLGTTNVLVRPLGEVLADIPGLSVINLLNIDAEGMDLNVLESNDWSRFIPEVIVVESHDFSSDTQQTHPTCTFLADRGYSLVFSAGPSLIFTREKRTILAEAPLSCSGSKAPKASSS